jgi:hypothetical protein
MDLQQRLDDQQCEQLALDQLYVEALKYNLQLKKQLILKDKEAMKLHEKINELTNEKEDLKAKIALHENPDVTHSVAIGPGL